MGTRHTPLRVGSSAYFMQLYKFQKCTVLMQVVCEWYVSLLLWLQSLVTSVCLRNLQNLDILCSVDRASHIISQINPTRCTVLFNIFLYFSSLHVSGIHVPIIRRKLLYPCDTGTCQSVWVAYVLPVGLKIQPLEQTPPVPSDKYHCRMDTVILFVRKPWCIVNIMFLTNCVANSTYLPV